ncbi:MAG: hypothetical protein M1830_010410 [Pleopsidium flavum]|nr:MAG: hypothetical protein M1830_010410 [Pleopsidium flavum]
MASASTTPAPPQTSTFTSTSTSTSRSSAANADANANAPLPPSSSKPGTPTLTPLEQEILNEYTRLLSNLNLVRPPFSSPPLTLTSPLSPSLPLPLLIPPQKKPTRTPTKSPTKTPPSNKHPKKTTVINLPIRPLKHANSRDPGQFETFGEEDESGVYVVEG